MTRLSALLAGLKFLPEEIAQKTQLSVDRVVAILNGGDASLSELNTIVKTFQLPHSALTESRPTAEIQTILFRNPLGKEDGEYTRERVADLVQGTLQILPRRRAVPAWLSKYSPREETYVEAHRLAHLFRDSFFSSALNDPATNLPSILSSAGIIICTLTKSRYEGASLIAGGYPFIFVSPRFAPRMLFTLAHELGHIVAHHQNGHDAIFERASEVAFGKRRSTREAFVDAFASVLLMPEGGVGEVLGAIRETVGASGDNIGDIELLFLARFFGVSFEVAARRCEDLKLLPAGGSRALTDALKANFGNPERRADELGLRPRAKINLPRVSEKLMFAITKKVGAGSVSIGWAAATFGLSIEQIHGAHSESPSDLRH